MNRAILILFAIFCGRHGFGQKGKVLLEVENIQAAKGGELSAAIFNGTNFLKTGKELATAAREVSNTTMVLVFDNLPAGEYAFVAYQDIDRNKSMKTNLIGYPKEPWGISNNPRIFFGPPSFGESKVRVSPNQTTTVSIRLNH
jgi:uncharacterized protein (DUF2141 family)